MLPFDSLFMDLAGKEVRVIHSFDAPDLPRGTFLFREFYCAEANCDCRRVLLHVVWAERHATVATLNYAFEPSKPPFDDEPRLFLDPLNPQSDLADTFLALFERMIADDRAYRARLERHYRLWKAVVDDPSHSQHPRLIEVKRTVEQQRIGASGAEP